MKKSHLLGSLILGVLLVAVTVVALSLSGVFGTTQGTFIVFETESQEKMYDGEPLTNPNWKIVEGQLKEGHTVIPTVYGAQTNAGASENKMSVKIVDANQADVTGEYRIEYRPGKLTVAQKSLKVASNSATKPFDGTPISCEAYRIVSGRLVNGHRLEVEFGMTRTDVGVSENIITVRVLDSANADVTANYALETINGSLTISGFPLTIMTESAEKVYDGTPLTSPAYQILSGELKDEDQMFVTVIGSQTEAGESSNEVSVQILNKEGFDVTSRYDIAKVLGKLTVKQRAVVVRSESKTVTYGEAHSNGGVLEHKSYFVSDTLAPNHTARVDVMGRVEGIGTGDNSFNIEICDENGNVVTQNYEITREVGKLEILPVDIVITSHDAYLTYKQFAQSGKDALTCDGYDTSVGSLMEGHTLCVNITGEQKTVGYSLNEFTVSIIDEDGNNVDHLYTIKQIYGVLEIGPIELTLGSSGFTKEYDGKMLSMNKDSDWWIVRGELYPGHEITRAVFLNSITDVGKVKNQVVLTICDSEGNDVTDSYTFLDEFGYLEITPLILYTTSEDYVDMYNGEVIRHDVYHITAGLEDLEARGHTIEVVFTEYPINVGEYTNRMSYVIKDADGNDITKNYFVEETEGKITVLPRVVTLRTESASKVYDGLPLTAPFWTVVSETDVVEGHRIVAVVTGEQTEIGKSENFLSELRVIVIETNQDVTPNYDLSGLQLGVLRVIDPSATNPLPEPTEPPPGYSGENILLAKIKSTVSGSVYLKEMSFGDYNGQYFDLVSSYDKYIDDTYGMGYLTSLAIGNSGLVSQRMDMEFLSSRYFLPYYLDTAQGDYRVQKSDVFYGDPACIDASLYYYDYWYSSSNTLPSVPNEYKDAEAEYREYVYNTYLTMDGHDKTREYLQGIIEEQGFKKDDPEILDKVASYIQNCATYNLDYDSDLDVEDDVVLAFMEVYREGVCRHYAMAATLMLRTLGIPARYTVGIYSDIKNPDEWTEVYSNTGHAWTEVYLDGIGWVALEVTGSDRNYPGTGNGGSGGGMGPGGGGGGGSGSGPVTLEITPVVDPVQYSDGMVLVATNKNTYFTGNQDFRDLQSVGYYITCDISGSISDVGYGAVTISNVKLFDKNGVEVTQDYKIVTKEGKLHLYEKALNVTSGSVTQDYTGNEITCETYENTPLLSPSHYIEVTFGSGRKDAGTSQNYFTCKVFEGVGAEKKDVTYKYHITKHYGQIKVNHLNITLTADQTQMSYDELLALGGVYEASLYTLEGSLFEGHSFEYVKQSGSIDKKGRQETIITSVKIVDENGRDVTSNYSITFKKGLIRVTR
ncbi:MAG: transglutaminase domain-containing protein [Clostridia bacterium]|nr:transglutaminase domain-containing protein [Clostridia bacterium]